MENKEGTFNISNTSDHTRNNAGNSIHSSMNGTNTTAGETIPKHDSPGVIQIKDDRERRDGPGGEDGE